MNEPNPAGSEGGWNAARVLGMIVGILGMVGFGFCGLCGLAFGISDSKLWGAVLHVFDAGPHARRAVLLCSCAP